MIRRTYICTILFLLVILCGGYAKGKSESPVDIEKKTIGVSLATQRNARWVRDKQAMEHYADIHEITLFVRFSDSDEYLQAYQIKKLVDLGIGVLIVAAESSSHILNALSYAHENGVFVIAYDTMISGTKHVDFYLAFDSEVYFDKIVSFEEIKSLEITEILDKKELLFYTDTEKLAQTTISLADRIMKNKVNVNQYQSVHNGAKEVPSILFEVEKITAKNIKNITHL